MCWGSEAELSSLYWVLLGYLFSLSPHTLHWATGAESCFLLLDLFPSQSSQSHSALHSSYLGVYISTLSFYFYLKKFFFIEVQLIYKVVLVSGIQKSDSVIHTYIYILFHILFHSGLSQDIEYSSLCYTVEPCCLSILHIIVCIC